MKPASRKPRPVPPPPKLLDLRVVCGILAACAVLTALSFALPWQNTTSGGLGFWNFPDGWVAALAAAAGLSASLAALPPGAPPGRRRRAAMVTLLACLVLLAAMSVFAFRTLAGQGTDSGSGIGSILGAILVLPWIFASVRCHSRFRALERRAPRPVPDAPAA